MPSIDTMERPPWDIDGYLSNLDAEYDGQLADILSTPTGRRLLTEDDPLLFAIVYMQQHITAELADGTTEISMSPAHLDFCDLARTWIDPLPTGLQENRHAFVCPRELGKTSWWFMLIPMWAAAHGHIKFIAAFADTADQAQLHLSSFRKELDENELLRMDYKDLCTPAARVGTGRSVADRQYLYIADNGFIFSARGLDTSVRGLKYGNIRPDVLLIDDAEPDESKYSAKLVEERKDALISNVFPLNMRARVVITGTTTMYGSIIHQMVRGDDWVTEQNIVVHHYKPILQGDEFGTAAGLTATGRAGGGKTVQRSLWPQKWTLDWLLRNMGYRWFRKEYLNEPVNEDGIYWTPDVFRYGKIDNWQVCLLSVDPAVTSKDKSDYSALSIVKFANHKGASGSGGKAGLASGGRGKPGGVVVGGSGDLVVGPEFEITGSWHHKVTPEGLRDRIIGILEAYPEITAVLVEVNQGGDLWKMAFRGLPVAVRTVTNDLPKPIRAAIALREYEVGNVAHAERFPELEGEMCSFPGLTDDLVDSVSTAIVEILMRAGRRKRPVLAGNVQYA